MKLRDIIIEAPVEDMQLLGNFDQPYPTRGWRAADKRLLSQPKTVERVKSFFRNTEHDIRIWLVSSKEAVRFQEIGLVNTSWLWQNMPETINQIYETGQGFGENSINIIYTNNQGAAWRPMTPWLMAHRLGHALYAPRGNMDVASQIFDELEKRITEITVDVMKAYSIQLTNNPTRNYYGYGSIPQHGNKPPTGLTRYDVDKDTFTMMKKLFHVIGTFRSARQGNIRTPLEFVFECFAQYMLTGTIKFNQLPNPIIVGYYYGRPRPHYARNAEEYYDANYKIDGMAEEMSSEFERALSAATGRVLVM